MQTDRSLLTLALDTTSVFTVFGLVQGDTLLAEEKFQAPLQMRDHLPHQLQQFLRVNEAAHGAIGGIALAIGPGSFTGLRVSLALAKGIAYARGIPVWPVSSLKVLAANAQGFDGTIATIIPARKGECYLGLYDGEELLPVHEPVCIDHAELETHVPEDAVLLGPAVAELPSEICEGLAAPLSRAHADFHAPSALRLALLARTEWQGREAPDVDSLSPFYLKEFPA
jgi:tRNA threonylcarbamoyladenosine biosynthesis protein TsaB